jgi:isopenicillin N synthase-like dioxygenase
LRLSSSDLSNISSADPAIRRTLVDEIRHACINVGFFYGAPYHQCHLFLHSTASCFFFSVKNHGIPEEIIQETLAMMRKFFDLPLDAKLEVSQSQFA